MSSRRRIAVLSVAIGAIALDTALLGLIAPLLPEIESRIGASESQLGLALSAYAIPIFLVSLPLGRLADRVGRRPLVLGGLALTVVGSVLIAYSDALGPLIAGRMIQGVGSAASWIAALALVSDLAPPGRKGQSIGYALAANSVGAIGGPAIGGLFGETIGFEFPFLLVGGLAAALATTGLFVLPKGPPITGASEADGISFASRVRSRLAVTVSRPVLPATVIVIVGAATLALIEVAVPLDADRRLGLSAAAIGALFAATITLDAIAAPIAGAAGDRHGRTPVAQFGLLITAGSSVLLAVLGGVVGLVIALSVYGIGVSVVFASAVPWLDEAFGELDRGLGYGFLNVIYSVGYAIGPLIGGIAVEIGGPDLAYFVSTAAVLGAGALLAARRAGGPASIQAAAEGPAFSDQGPVPPPC